MHNGNTKWTALSSETETLLISWVCLGSAERSGVQVPGTSGCPKALRIIGSIKHHHRVQHGPGSLQYWSLLQPTTGIKNQLHTSVKAKHYRPSAALLSFQEGTPAVPGTAPRHPKTAGLGLLVPGFSLSQLHSQSINKIHLEHFQRFPIAPHALPHRVSLGAPHTLLPHHSCTSSAAHPWEFPAAAGIKEGNDLLPLSASHAFPSQHWHLMSVVTFSILCETLLPVRVWLKQWQIFFCRSSVKGHDCAIPQAANLTDCNSLNPKLKREHRGITEGEGESVIYTIKLFNSH